MYFIFDNSCTAGQYPSSRLTFNWIIQILWSCYDNCRYECMWPMVRICLKNRWKVPQFGGKVIHNIRTTNLKHLLELVRGLFFASFSTEYRTKTREIWLDISKILWDKRNSILCWCKIFKSIVLDSLFKEDSAFV